MNQLSKTTIVVWVGVLLIATLGIGYLFGSVGSRVDTDTPKTEPPVPVVQDAAPAANAVPKDVPEVTREVSATLDMSSQELVALPLSLFERTDLVRLNLSHNALTGAMPAEIRHLQNLTWLDLSYNQFTGVPAEIGQLSNLRYLDLSHNRLTGLPLELGQLQQLEVLDLTGNEYAEADLATIRMSLPRTTKILGL